MSTVTALYDCRSKQAYIYRTNKIKEISGASQILSHVYERMIAAAHDHGITILNTWDTDFEQGKPFDKAAFERSGADGTVIYEGGGNLYVLYKDRETYVRVNRLFSRMLLETTYSVSIIAACVESSDNFAEDRKRLYQARTQAKNLGTYTAACNVLPFTQLDRMTCMPVVSKKDGRDKTLEALHKQAGYALLRESERLHTEELDKIIRKKGDSSLLAVIYIDGNDMGTKVKNCTAGLTGYADCVDALRRFSLKTNECFVEIPRQAIRKRLETIYGADAGDRLPYRIIIAGGDEITIICRAEDAASIVLAYFEALGRTEPLDPDSTNASCAGIAIFHSHAPFADVYEIAEACCESGKKKTRSSGSQVSYIDFHYCHAGITNELDMLREEQEANYTARPYTVEEFKEFCGLMKILGKKCIGRSNVKTLGEAIVQSNAAYRFECERLRARDTDGSFTRLLDNENADKLRRRIYDASVVFDLWAEKEDA